MLYFSITPKCTRYNSSYHYSAIILIGIQNNNFYQSRNSTNQHGMNQLEGKKKKKKKKKKKWS